MYFQEFGTKPWYKNNLRWIWGANSSTQFASASENDIKTIYFLLMQTVEFFYDDCIKIILFSSNFNFVRIKIKVPCLNKGQKMLLLYLFLMLFI